MSQFYASIQGGRSEATRQGTKESGIISHTCGWNFGVKVIMSVDETGRDVATVYLTTGSNGKGYSNCLGTFQREMAEDLARHTETWLEDNAHKYTKELNENQNGDS